MAEEAQTTELEDRQKSLATKHLGADLVAFITEETPKGLIEWRTARGGRRVPYVKSASFTARFNQAFGFLWDLDVIDTIYDEKAKQIVAKVRVTVKIPGQHIKRTFPDGTIEEIWIDPVEIGKTQFGGSDVKLLSSGGGIIDLADDFKAAVSDGKKKCGSEFGFFLDVYSMGGESDEADAGASSENKRLINKWGEKAGMSEEEINQFCQDTVGMPFGDLDNAKALDVVNKLRDKAQG